MRKILTIGLLSVLFISPLAAQTEFGLTTGLSANWIRSNLDGIEIPVTPGIKLGFFVRRDIIENNFTIETGIDYSYLFSSGTYKVEYLQNPGYNFADFIVGLLNDDLSRFDFHQLSLPLIFQFNSKYVQPYFGMEAYVKTTKSYYEEYSEEPSIIGMAGGGTLISLKIPLPNQLNCHASNCSSRRRCRCLRRWCWWRRCRTP